MIRTPFLFLFAVTWAASLAMAALPVTNDPSPLLLHVEKINGVQPERPYWMLTGGEQVELSLKLDHVFVSMRSFLDPDISLTNFAEKNDSINFEGSQAPPQLQAYKASWLDIGRAPKTTASLATEDWAEHVPFKINKISLVGMAEGLDLQTRQRHSVVLDKEQVDIVAQSAPAKASAIEETERALNVTFKVPTSFKSPWFKKAGFYRLEIEVQPTQGTVAGYRPFGVTFVLTNLAFRMIPSLDAPVTNNTEVLLGGSGIDTMNAAHVSNLRISKEDDLFVLLSPKMTSGHLPWEKITLSNTMKNMPGEAHQLASKALQEQFGQHIDKEVLQSFVDGVAASILNVANNQTTKAHKKAEEQGEQFSLKVGIDEFKRVAGQFSRDLRAKYGAKLTSNSAEMMDDMAVQTDMDPVLYGLLKDATLSAKQYATTYYGGKRDVPFVPENVDSSAFAVAPHALLAISLVAAAQLL